MNIIRRLEKLRHTEHSSTVEIIKALVVCNNERAWVDLGYASIWAYLIEGLQYSQAAASRRYRAMKCASDFPQVIGMLRDHRVSLSSLSKVESLLHEVDDPVGLLERICGKSQVQVERIVAAERPVEQRPREVVKRTFVKRVPVGVHGDVPGAGLFGEGCATAESRTPMRTSAAEVKGSGTVLVVAEERVTLRTSLTAERFEALERARAIYSRKNPAATVEDLLNELVDHYLASKAPKVRKKRGEMQMGFGSEVEASGLKAAGQGAAGPAVAGQAVAGQEVAGQEVAGQAVAAVPDREIASGKPRAPETTNSDCGPTRRSRHIPAALRDEVMLRDGQRCTFVGKSGHRCSATHNLQIDHIRPFALGGEHSAKNLRVLCATHNRREAEKVFGNRTVPQRSKVGGSSAKC